MTRDEALLEVLLIAEREHILLIYEVAGESFNEKYLPEIQRVLSVQGDRCRRLLKRIFERG